VSVGGVEVPQSCNFPVTAKELTVTVFVRLHRRRVKTGVKFGASMNGAALQQLVVERL